MNRLRKFLSAGVMLMTILAMTVVVSPADAATLNDGDLVKIANSSTVFYFNDGVVYPFPNEKTYFTWYSDWTGIKTITMSELDMYSRGANVTVRPGTRLVTTPTTAMVYAVEPGNVLRSIVSEANAIELWGGTWAQNVVDVPDSFFGNYTVGAGLELGMYPAGSLVNPTGTMDIYYVSDEGEYRKFEDEVSFLQNNYSFDDVVTTDKNITATGDMITGAEATLVTVAGSGVTNGGGTTPVGGSGLTVALAADTPASTVLPDGATGVTFSKLNLTASNDGAVTIQSLTLTRNGIGDPSSISKVYLYDGNSRLTTGKTINSTTNKAVITNLDYSVPAGTTKTLSVVVDITAGVADNHALGIASASDITTSGATVSGSFPVMGNTMSISNVDLGTVTIDRAGSALYTRTIGETQEIVGKFQMVTVEEDAEFNRITIYNSGNDVLDNMTLYRGTELLATANENGRYYEFALEEADQLTKGETLTYTLKADISADNTSNSATLYIRYDADVHVVGKTFGYGLDVTNNYVSGTPTTVSLQGGDVTITTSGPSASEVAKDSNDVILQKFNFTAQNDTRVEAMDFNLGGTILPATQVENLEFFCDGIGLIESWSTPAASNTSTEQWEIQAGETTSCELRIDILNTADDGDTINGVLEIGNWTFRDLVTDSLITTNIVPSSNLTGYGMTVRAASLTAVAATTPASRTWVAGTDDVELAGFAFTAGEASDMTVTDITLTTCFGNTNTTGDCAGVTGNKADEVILSMSLYAGDTKIGETKSINSSTGTAEFTNLNWELAAGQTKTLIVKGDLNTTVPTSSPDYVSVGMAVGAVSAEYSNKSYTATDVPAAVINVASGTTASNFNLTTVVHQTIETSGSLAIEVPTSTPNSKILVAGTNNVHVADLKVTASNEDFTLTKMALRNLSTTADDSIAGVYVKYPTNAAGTETATTECVLVSSVATCTGMTAYIPNPDVAGNPQYATLQVMVDAQTIAAGADAGIDQPGFTLTLAGDLEATGMSSGAKIYEQTISITNASNYVTATNINEDPFAIDDTTLTVDSGTGIAAGDFITIESEELFVSAVSTNDLTVVRGVNGTDAAAHADGVAVTKDTSALDTNAFYLQGTKLTFANQVDSKTGAQNTAETVMNFTITADSAGDAKIRKGDMNPADTVNSDFYTSAYAGTWEEIDAGTGVSISAPTSGMMEGVGHIRLTDAAGASVAGDGLQFGFTASANLSAYTGVAFWIRSSAVSTGADDTPNWAVKVDGTTLGTYSITTVDDWELVQYDFGATDVSSIDDIQVIASHAPASGQTLDIDNMMLYKERVVVDFTLNAASTTVKGGTAYLEQNGNVVAVGALGWEDTAGSSSTGHVVFFPYNTYGEFTISGTDTWVVKVDTTNFTDSTGTETLSATLDLGYPAQSTDTNSGIYWYDVRGTDNVTFAGVNSTDKVTTTVRY